MLFTEATVVANDQASIKRELALADTTDGVIHILCSLFLRHLYLMHITVHG